MMPPVPRIDRRALAARITQHRERIGLSRRELADDAEISESALSGYETARATPGSDILARLALCLGVRADALLGLPLRPAAPMSERRA
jgi:transcriptional regulator with XRE-family HTH domain